MDERPTRRSRIQLMELVVALQGAAAKLALRRPTWRRQRDDCPGIVDRCRRARSDVWRWDLVDAFQPFRSTVKTELSARQAARGQLARSHPSCEPRPRRRSRRRRLVAPAARMPENAC